LHRGRAVSWGNLSVLAAVGSEVVSDGGVGLLAALDVATPTYYRWSGRETISDRGGVATNCHDVRTRRGKKKEKRVVDSESRKTSYLYSPLLPC
jgi:hypothetical protein